MYVREVPKDGLAVRDEITSKKKSRDLPAFKPFNKERKSNWNLNRIRVLNFQMLIDGFLCLRDYWLQGKTRLIGVGILFGHITYERRKNVSCHSPQSLRTPPIGAMGCVYLSISWLEMGAGLKKDLLVWRIGTGGSLNAFFFLLIGVLSQRLAMVRKKGGTSTLGERSTMESCMLRKDESLPKRNLLILSRTVGAMIYFTGEGSESRYAWDCISTSIMETGL